MNTLQLEKFEGVAKVLRVIFKIIWIIAIIGAVLALIGAIASMLIPTSFIDKILSLDAISGNLTISGIAFDIKDISMDSTVLKEILTAACIEGIIAAAITALIFILLEKILKQVVNKTPFAIESIKSMKLLSVAIVVYSIASSLCQSVIDNMIVKLIPTLTNINQSSFNFDIDLSIIFVGLLIFLLAKIFEYGHALQTEVDETL